MSSINKSEDQEAALEVSLKGLLDKILSYSEKFLTSKAELKELENKLEDYETLVALVNVITTIFEDLTQRVNKKIELSGGDNYSQLEKVVQKHESEIRKHIRVEQQLKLFSENVQSNLEQSEKARTALYEQTSATIATLARENEKLMETVKQKTSEVEKLNINVKELEVKLKEVPVLKERINQLAQSKELPSSATIRRDSLSKILDNENSRKIETEGEIIKIKSKQALSNKAIRPMVINQSMSPLRLASKTLSTNASSTNEKDFIRLKLKVDEINNLKDLEMLRRTQTKLQSTEAQRESEQERRRDSLSKSRELRSKLSIPAITQSSNSSYIQVNHNLSQKEILTQKYHQRSSSHSSRNRLSAGFVKLGSGL